MTDIHQLRITLLDNCGASAPIDTGREEEAHVLERLEHLPPELALQIDILRHTVAEGHSEAVRPQSKDRLTTGISTPCRETRYSARSGFWHQRTRIRAKADS